MKIIDTNDETTRVLPALKADGIDTIIRYLSTNLSGSKAVKPPEARAIAAAGMKLGLVFEIWGGANNFEHGDINAATGNRHGEFARNYAPTVGAPDGTIIWFAIDTDVSGNQFERIVKPYLIAVKAGLAGRFRIGPYACGDACAKALDQNLVDATWLTQSMGWTGSRAFRDSKRWRLLQGPETKLHGLSIDSNTANGDDYGQFTPWAGAQASAPAPASPDPPAPAPVPTISERIVWIQHELNARGADLKEDGNAGPLTLAAIRKFIESNPAI